MEVVSNWRQLMDEMPWLAHDVVIMSNAAKGSRHPRRRYDCYIRGRLVATRPRLDEAQQFIESRVKVDGWRKVEVEPMVVEHPTLGRTDLFGLTHYWTAR